ncbi:DUF1905 domain-containing protein [Hymenobacter sp. BT507]|uniref:DUF1905 domain-containing protein n=1 Tax=Hymenobacter citatus TaxID=2763506 RepID=A0ABR7MM89_9BACT|nr:YdeI/OmpD-associated family protein [Hymenobacter citatus]MBC6612203.1 DUF1905 domain-containing protein [Hymenobacter citatus]
MTSSLEQSFEAALELHDTDGGVFLLIPFDVAEVYGAKGSFPIIGTMDGFPIRLSLTPAGPGEYELRVPKEVRKAIDKNWPETVQVVLRPDTEETLELPKPLAQALRSTGLQTQFDKLSYPERKELAQWVARAKTNDARHQRIQEILDRFD